VIVVFRQGNDWPANGLIYFNTVGVEERHRGVGPTNDRIDGQAIKG